MFTDERKVLLLECLDHNEGKEHVSITYPDFTLRDDNGRYGAFYIKACEYRIEGTNWTRLRPASYSIKDTPPDSPHRNIRPGDTIFEVSCDNEGDGKNWTQPMFRYNVLAIDDTTRHAIDNARDAIWYPVAYRSALDTFEKIDNDERILRILKTYAEKELPEGVLHAIAVKLKGAVDNTIRGFDKKTSDAKNPSINERSYQLLKECWEDDAREEGTNAVVFEMRRALGSLKSEYPWLDMNPIAEIIGTYAVEKLP
ncbi:MAG: hypothetical protein QW548_01845 [Candidatus Aenigmatarchaeota archaeon]